ncbi:unnamed protein product [Camellia sinensis]
MLNEMLEEKARPYIQNMDNGEMKSQCDEKKSDWVYFKTFKKGYLTILEDSSDAIEEGTTLLIRPPFLGSWGLKFELLDGSFHLVQWARKISRQLVEGLSHFMVLLLKSSNHEEVEDLSSFPTFGSAVRDQKVAWGPIFKAIAEPSFCEGYWEWLEDVLGQHCELLNQAGICDAIYASLFTYDQLHSVMWAFCELWCPSINTLQAFIGEMSILLWDLR